MGPLATLGGPLANTQKKMRNDNECKQGRTQKISMGGFHSVADGGHLCLM